MFEGFESVELNVGETTIFARIGGRGEPVLLLHGFPETHAMWHAIAPALARDFAVVCADLRGYGASGTPPSDATHAPYAKSAMARDMVRLMTQLGHERFTVVGHDRGGRVGYRMALDHPGAVERLAVLDIIPTGEAFRRADGRFALGYWPWSLLAQPAPLPERLIGGNPQAIIHNALDEWGSEGGDFPAEVRTAYAAALSDPASVHAICEEYRAAATLDIAQDEMDRQAGRRISCPTLVLWGAGGPLDLWYDNAGGPLGIWREWADRVEGRAIKGGHFFPETNASETLAQLRRFLY
jgi:haloacetate dehalogenase